MSEPTKEKKKGKREVDWDAISARAMFEANTQRLQEMQSRVTMSLKPWLDIQANLERQAEISSRMAMLAAQAERSAIISSDIQQRMIRMQALVDSIRLPDINPSLQTISALKQADVDTNELVEVIQKLKRKLKLKEQEINALKKYIVEGKRKKEYVS